MAPVEDKTTSAQESARQMRMRTIATIDTLALIGVVVCTLALVVSFLPYDAQRLESEDIITLVKLTVRTTLPWLLLIGAVLLYISSRLIRSRRKCPNCGMKAPKYLLEGFTRRSLPGGWTCLNCGYQVERHGNRQVNADAVSADIAEPQSIALTEELATDSQREMRRNIGCAANVIGRIVLLVVIFFTCILVFEVTSSTRTGQIITVFGVMVPVFTDSEWLNFQTLGTLARQFFLGRLPLLLFVGGALYYLGGKMEV